MCRRGRVRDFCEGAGGELILGHRAHGVGGGWSGDFAVVEGVGTGWEIVARVLYERDAYGALAVVTTHLSALQLLSEGVAGATVGTLKKTH